MGSLLDDLAADVTAALSGELRTGTLWQYSLVDDGFGNEIPTYDTSHAFEGLRGSYDAAYAGLSGIPREAVTIEILASSLSVEPKRLDKITLAGGWWIITEIAIDPAGAMWICQGADTVPVA